MENNIESGDADASGFSFSAGNAATHSFDSMFSGVSLQSLLTLNPSLLADYPTLAFITDPNSHSPSLYEDECASNTDKLIVPKKEPLQIQDGCQTRASSSLTTPSQPLDSFSNSPSQPHSQHFYNSSTTFHRLPQLHSVEVNSLVPGPDSSFARKRPRYDSLNSVGQDSYLPSPILNSIFTATQMQKSKGKPSSSSLLDTPPVGPKSHRLIPQSNLARQRRQRISDKTRCLQKLMPWDKKMDQATLFEEAYKYVKFLKAQLYALQSMPSVSDSDSSTSLTNNTANGLLFGDLERLSRTQVLQVLVNSPVAQTMLYAQGLCVFSVEQLTLLKNISDRKLLLQQTMLDNPASKAYFNKS
ncbi:hypothetical protein L6164_018806 [Bauhinia variegata]|uniref:Uncharacterized protein n=1 Tax=Bauhinia variegata TaxID=167791 RepID=A0ACB9NED6_BAUVA|nr:hypothetical protein L6164_018806 [Bauhinia variegata]